MTDIVAIARGWIGTPYLHQGSTRGAGTDCLGLIRGIWREAFGAEPEPVPAYTADWTAPQGEELLWRAAGRHLDARPLEIAAPGDVLLFRMRNGAEARHLGIQSEVGATARFIHAYSGHGVVESHLSAPWERRIVARFAFRTGS
ncbi:NlpC/P60 family protein [Pelagovum pacificum]|uniref:Peptidase n=1 Tax=Pelagovum pacificum TaxID=2588711 RepID=A0A5C5GBN2_9RHOB|nr:NlpC/P60 family protein [Pelagovum pacificum]QQA41232.1 C40 family peptidase [Pelagovum pacificum]TNY31960.1 peptidase [Pelagovum pacificum]